MRVTILSSLPPQRGISPYTTQLLGALADCAGVDVEALGFSSLYPRFAYPGGAPEAGGGESIPVPAKSVLTWYNPLSWIWAGMTVGGDVLHAQWWSWFLAPPYAVVLTLARLRGKRIVVTAHNVRPHEASGWKRRLNDFIMRRAHQIIVHAEHNRAVLIDAGFAPERISVVRMGAHTLTGAAVTRRDARAALGIADDERVVLLFGNVRPYKGVDVLLRAAAMARSRVQRLRVIVAGELWRDCPDPRPLARKLGVEDITTFRLEFAAADDVARLFAASDLAVFPYTHFDAQSAAAASALSSGRAMIVSDAGGLPDLVRDPRAVVAAGDAEALAEALARVLGDDALREKLEADAALVRDELGWGRIAEATVDVYRRTLRERKPADAGASEGELDAVRPGP